MPPPIQANRPLLSVMGRLSPRIWICLLLVTATFAAYWPVWRFGFVDFDDWGYVYANPHIPSGLTALNIKWAFTNFDVFNYHPLTWISILADATVFGARPQGMHVENVLLHVVNVILLFLLLLETTADFWPSAIVAAILALHPTHVESVAWITERKDVLFLLFFLLATRSYVRYSAPARAGRRTAYLAAIGFFTCGLLSKSMLVTFPFLLLLIDWWPLRRLGTPRPADSALPEFRAVTFRRAILEKIPFLLIAIALAILGYKAQVAITASLQTIPLGLRAQNAVVSYAGYLAESFWPINLSPLYPYRWEIRSSQVIGDAAILVILTFAVFIPAGNRRIRAVGWLWFLGTLTPVIGFVQVGPQAMADRFLYLPSIGLSILAVWTVRPLANRIGKRAVIVAMVLLFVIFGGLTRRQVGYWADTDHLRARASLFMNGRAVAEVQLGVLAAQRGDRAAAEQHYRAALTVEPGNYTAEFNLGNLLLSDNPEQAIQHYQSAAMKDPSHAEVQINWGVAELKLNNPAAAFTHFKRAESLAPDSYDAHYNLARLYLAAGKLPEAREEFSLALQAKPTDPAATDGLQTAK